MSHKIKFYYDEETIEVTKANITKEVTRPVIKCNLKDGDNTLSTATVRLYQKDANNKIKGRTFAFKKAVNEITDKEIRTTLWKQFRTNMRQAS